MVQVSKGPCSSSVKRKCGISNFQGKALAPHSSILAWRIPWMEEPGGLQSMGSLGVGQDWETSLSLFTFMHWRWNWQPTPVFLPGESQGWRSLVGWHLWGLTESDTTEATEKKKKAPTDLNWYGYLYSLKLLISNTHHSIILIHNIYSLIWHLWNCKKWKHFEGSNSTMR